MAPHRTHAQLLLIGTIVLCAILAILNSRTRLDDQTQRFQVADDYIIQAQWETTQDVTTHSNSIQTHSRGQPLNPVAASTTKLNPIPELNLNMSLTNDPSRIHTNQSIIQHTGNSQASLLRSWASTMLASYLHSTIPKWKSCVLLCSKKRQIEFTLPKGQNCSSALYCEFMRFRTHELHSIKYDHKRRVLCPTNNPRKAICPTFYSSDCSSFSWIERQVRLSLASKSLYTRFMDLTPRPGHSFRIYSVLPSHIPNHTLVVSFYLPSMLYSSKCNQIYCMYSNYETKQFEAYPAIIGDVTFAYCPNPSPSISHNNQTFLQIGYHPDLMSYPYSFKVADVAPSENTTQVQLTICAIVRKEGPHLVEWIEFHRMVGVSRFILYDNNPLSTPDLLMEKVLRAYGSILVRRRWPSPHSQTEAYTDCINRYGSTTEWMTLIDVDEFIVPHPGFKSITEVIDEQSAKKASMHMKWLTFGPCGKKPKLEYQLTMEVCKTWTKPSSDFPKSLFRPSFVAGMQNFGPHFIRLRSDIGVREFSKSTETTKLRLYHYRYRTYTDFIGRRLGPRAGRALHWDAERLEYEWNKGLNNSHFLGRRKNWIIRFRESLRHRLVVGTRKVGSIVLDSMNTTAR